MALPDLEMDLLALLFSACSAQTLLRLEVAFGSRRQLRTSAQHCLNWHRTLQRELGLTVSTCDKEFATVKAVFLLLPRVSSPVDGGWQGIHISDLHMCASTVHDLHCAHPTNREILDPSRRLLGLVRRIGMAHFDVRGCFGEGWDAMVNGFRNPMPTRGLPTARSATSSVSLGGGPKFDFALTLGPFLHPATERPGAPADGLLFSLDAERLAAYFNSHMPPPHQRDQRDPREFLHLACVLRCGDVERSSSHVLMWSPRGVEWIDSRPFWRLIPRRNFGISLSIELLCDNVGEVLIDEEVANAQWNMNLTSTELVPLVWFSDNLYLSNPVQHGCEGAVVLVRRGGGCGFAQKTLCAQTAGAVGCIIYEADDDRHQMGDVHTMGSRYGGQDFPAPRIPCLLVQARHASILLDCVSFGGARVRLNLDRSEAELRRPPSSFVRFQELARRGEPVHAAILAEAVDRAGVEGVEQQRPSASSFRGLGVPRNGDPANESYVQIAVVTVHGQP